MRPERQMGDSGRECHGDEVGEAIGERSGAFTLGTAMLKWSCDEGMSSVSEDKTSKLGEFCILITLVSLKVSSRPRRCVSSGLWCTCACCSGNMVMKDLALPRCKCMATGLMKITSCEVVSVCDAFTHM